MKKGGARMNTNKNISIQTKMKNKRKEGS